MKVFLRWILLLFCFVLFACGVDSKGMKKTDKHPWSLVNAFGTETIIALYVNSDSTEMHVMTPTYYGYRSLTDNSQTFQKHTLPHQYTCNHNGWGFNMIPYFTDDHCFFCNPAGDTMYVYAIGNNTWSKVGELHVQDFTSDDQFETERFAQPYAINIPNHIIHMSGDEYFVTTESRNDTFGMAAKYQQHLIHLNFTPNVSYSLVYHSQPQYERNFSGQICSTYMIDGRFMQDRKGNRAGHIVLTVDSPDSIPGTLTDPNCYVIKSHHSSRLLGLFNNHIAYSTDRGINWTFNGYTYAVLAYSEINHHHIFYNTVLYCWDSIESFNDTDCYPLAGTGLEGTRLLCLVQLGENVYMGTTKGLFVKSLSHFFDYDNDSKSTTCPAQQFIEQ